MAEADGITVASADSLQKGAGEDSGQPQRITPELPTFPEASAELERKAGAFMDLLTYWYPYLRKKDEPLFRAVFDVVRGAELCKGSPIFKLRPSARPIVVASSLLLQMRAIDCREEVDNCLRDEVWYWTGDREQSRSQELDHHVDTLWNIVRQTDFGLEVIEV